MNESNEFKIKGLAEAVQFIADIFKQDPKAGSFRDEEKRHLPESIKIVSDVCPERIRSALGGNKVDTIVAIDGGSSSLLASGNFEIGVCRASMVTFHNERRISFEVTPEWIVPAGEGLSSPIISAFCNTNQATMDCVSEWRFMTNICREMLEYSCLRSLAGRDDNPAMILIDGALGCPSGVDPADYSDLLLQLHRKNKVVVCVSKSSTLRWADNCPLLSRMAEMTMERPKGDIWFLRISELRDGYEESADIPNLYLANLYAGLGPILRLDIPSIYGRDEESIICALAGHAEDPEFPGYPYPLVEAHRLARILPARKKELFGLIKMLAVDSGVGDTVFDAAFADYHDRLNADVSSEILALGPIAL
ncbi:MAG: hypothetical protein CO189_05545 [candidate division Zixibacteria bacterium CG_4_9_14_3_um_filter_46_8]|nr:MAG: hypothetical protein CO189_05545 [candidate division Zixibacteria bacterium CG_4_9_14_3_um_filter_46_8]